MPTADELKKKFFSPVGRGRSMPATTRSSSQRVSPDYGFGVRKGNAFQDAVNTIKSMPTGPGSFKGAAGKARSQTRRIKQAEALSKLYSDKAALNQREAGATERTRMGEVGASSRNRMSELAATGRTTMQQLGESSRQQAGFKDKRDAETARYGREKEAATTKFGREQLAAKEASNRGFAQALAEKGVADGPALTNLYESPGQGRVDLQGLQVPSTPERLKYYEGDTTTDRLGNVVRTPGTIFGEYSGVKGRDYSGYSQAELEELRKKKAQGLR